MLTPKQRWQNIKESWESIFNIIVSVHHIDVFSDIGFKTTFTIARSHSETCEITLDKIHISYWKERDASASLIRYIVGDIDIGVIEDFDGPWLDFLEDKAKEYKVKVEKAIETFPKRQAEKARRMWDAPPCLGRSD